MRSTNTPAAVRVRSVPVDVPALVHGPSSHVRVLGVKANHGSPSQARVKLVDPTSCVPANAGTALVCLSQGLYGKAGMPTVQRNRALKRSTGERSLARSTVLYIMAGRTAGDGVLGDIQTALAPRHNPVRVASATIPEGRHHTTPTTGTVADNFLLRSAQCLGALSHAQL